MASADEKSLYAAGDEACPLGGRVQLSSGQARGLKTLVLVNQV